MKKLFSVILIMLSCCAIKAQTVDEWIKQKETQKKYLIQQIAAFKSYLGYVQKGYTITRKALTTISNIKNGDFTIHKDFITSFQSVNPVIGRYGKVVDIIAFQVRILRSYKSAFKQVKANSLFSPSETNYIEKVYTELINKCATDIEELTAIITANDSEMKDDERLKRIDAIHANAQEKCVFTERFREETTVLAVQRAREKNNVEKACALYGIKN